MTHLIISHNIFLTREQRYSWHSGKDLDVIGVNVPVWFGPTKTSEPAQEVFCRYMLSTGDRLYISSDAQKCYKVYVPKEREPDITAEFDFEEWRPKSDLPCLKSILDIRDGGSEWIAFKQMATLDVNKKKINIVHVLEIKSMEELTQTLV